MVEGVVAMFRKTISLDESILQKNRIPLLIKEPEWVKLFGDNKNKYIQESKEELNQLLTRQNVLKSYYEKLQKKKRKYMKMILNVSESVNNENNNNKEKHLELLDEYKEKILEINEEIEDVKFQIETLPKEIRNSNFQLLTATVEYGYNELKSREKILNKSLVEIDILREKLKTLLEIKYSTEEWINETYTFLHDILGSEVIEEIDRENFK